MSWIVVIIMAVAFYLYYMQHSQCHIPKKCQDCKKRKRLTSTRTACPVSSVEKSNQYEPQHEELQNKTSSTQSSDSMITVSNNNLTVHGVVKVHQNEMHLPIKSDIFRTYMQLCTEFAIQYLGKDEEMYKVTTDLAPGFLLNKLPREPPNGPEKFSELLKDIYQDILPGLTHWQHPRFFGYFQHGCSYPDIIAEFLIASIGVVQFSYDSSPAFTELEIAMVNWLGRSIGLSEDFLFNTQSPENSPGGGAFQPSSSDSIFIALLAARDRQLSKLMPNIDTEPDYYNKKASYLPKLVAYASHEAHSSIEKACQMAMVILRPVKSDDAYIMRGNALEHEIRKDIERGYFPFFVLATCGTTSVASFDKLDEICNVAKIYNLWVHADGAYGFGAMICPENRYLSQGVNDVDSVNMNAHKLLLCSNSCTILWTRHQSAIRKAFMVNGTYLRKTKKGVVDFRHWGISLSRRAKALKLWVLFRLYGLYKLQDYIRRLMRLTERLQEKLEDYDKIFVVTAQLTLITFKVVADNTKKANQLTIALCEYINNTHQLLVTHARVHDVDIIRVCVSNERSNEQDIDKSWTVLKDLMDKFFESDIYIEKSKKTLDELDESESDIITTQSHGLCAKIVTSCQTVDSTESQSSSSSESDSKST